jgi:transcription antitermination factor NusG
LDCRVRRQERNGVVHLPRQPKYRRGDKVRIIAEPFAGSWRFVKA